MERSAVKVARVSQHASKAKRLSPSVVVQVIVWELKPPTLPIRYDFQWHFYIAHLGFVLWDRHLNSEVSISGCVGSHSSTKRLKCTVSNFFGISCLCCEIHTSLTRCAFWLLSGLILVQKPLDADFQFFLHCLFLLWKWTPLQRSVHFRLCHVSFH